jgi:hypothetical protein
MGPTNKRQRPEYMQFTYKGVAAVVAAAIVAMVFSSPADARVRKQKRYVMQAPSSDWRMQPPSLDGRIVGRARTCGYATFQYDNLGVPYGPYCH